ncbi:YgaP-like transmembrane domain [Flavitalea flava]
MHDHDEYSTPATVNVGHKERTLSAVAGSLLLYFVMKKNKKETLLALAGGYLVYRGISGHCPVYSLREHRLSAKGPDGSTGHNINVRAQVVVNRPRKEVYAFWRKLENLNLFMEHVENIREIDDKKSTWMVKIPGGLGTINWEAEIVKEEEDRELSWISQPGASIENAGKINFSDTPGNATRIDALISYRAPMGSFGEGLSRLLTPLFRRRIEADITNFKYYMENAR